MAMVQDPYTGEWYEDGNGNVGPTPNANDPVGSGYGPLAPGVTPTQVSTSIDTYHNDGPPNWFPELLDRPPTEAERAEAARIFQQGGGDLMREYIVSLRGEGGAASGGGGGGGGRGGNFGDWMPGFAAPKFAAPPKFSYDEFSAPTLEQAREAPGYKFAAQEGQQRLESSAAGRGVLRTGGTLKDLYAWGNQFAEQNYSNEFGRSLDTYKTNRGNAADTYATNYGVSRDVFDRDYMGALDEYRPKQRQAELNFGRSSRMEELEFGRQWDQYLADLELKKFIFGAGQD